MRIGAIFARGSCRALKWMALLGVVFALGGVDAAAQNLTIRDVGLDSYTLTEGRTARVTVTVNVPPTLPDGNTDLADAVVIQIVGLESETNRRPGIDTGEGVETDDFTFLGLEAPGDADTTALRATKTKTYLATDVGRVLEVDFDIELRHDDDAEDEKFYVEAWVVTDKGTSARGTESYATTEPRRIAVIDDNETQEYIVSFWTARDALTDSVQITTASGSTMVSEGDTESGTTDGTTDGVHVRLQAKPARTIPLYYSVLVDGRSQTNFVDVVNPTTEGSILNADGTGSWTVFELLPERWGQRRRRRRSDRSLETRASDKSAHG